jgi:hypothetical protein
MALHNLDLVGAYYTSHVGETLHFLLWDDADTTATVTAWSETVDDQAEFSSSLAGVLMAGHSYTLAYYAEHSLNTECDAPPAGDHGWTHGFTAAGDEMISLDHNTDFDLLVCDHF